MDHVHGVVLAVIFRKWDFHAVTTTGIRSCLHTSIHLPHPQNGQRNMALPEDLTKLRVVDLRDELTKRNLPTKGKKNELIERLEEALQQEPEVAQKNASEEVITKDEDKPVDANGESKDDAGHENDATAPTELTDPQAILDIPIEEDSSMHVQGKAEMEVEQKQEPVVTKESSGLVDQSMNVEEERGQKRKTTDDIADSEGWQDH